MSGIINFWTELENESQIERALDEGLHIASDGLRKALADGLDAGAAEARATHPYQDRTHKLTDSIRGRVEVSAPGAAVGVIEATAKYSQFVERGTEPHEIESRRHGKRRALHWVSGGQDFFARRVNHPGTDPRPFIAPAAQAAERYIERQIELDIVMNLERHLKG
jgi:hypothetical protein